MERNSDAVIFSGSNCTNAKRKTELEQKSNNMNQRVARIVINLQQDCKIKTVLVNKSHKNKSLSINTSRTRLHTYEQVHDLV